jgi:hypothetical protein
MSEPLMAELRSTVGFVVCGGILIVAGGVVAAVDSAAPFAHGSWLAAYLVLVGGVAQILLAGGRAAIVSGSGRSRGRLVLWNVGSLAVPAGVLADASAWVTAGSVALLCALALFAQTGFQPAPGRRAQAVAYLVLVVSLAASVVVGSALADAAPAGWL